MKQKLKLVGDGCEGEGYDSRGGATRDLAGEVASNARAIAGEGLGREV